MSPAPGTCRVRACVVSYRSGAAAARACRSAASEGAEVALFDNSPGDGAAEAVRREVPGATVLSSPRNLGFAAGSNRAAEGAETDYLLFLNPDAVLEDGALDALVRRLDEDPAAGIAGPALRFPDGRDQPSVHGDPTARAILHQYTVWRYLLLFRGAWRRYRSPPVPPEGGPVDVLMGSVLLVRTSLFRELGGFDERYFMYFEEADLCRRARDRGAAALFVPAAGAVHEGGASAVQAIPALAAPRLVSAQRYLRRFSPPFAYVLFKAAFLTGFPLRAMLDLCRHAFYAAWYALHPGRRERARRKVLAMAAAARLLSADLFRVAAG